jgi:hypothetical protein
MKDFKQYIRMNSIKTKEREREDGTLECISNEERKKEKE